MPALNVDKLRLALKLPASFQKKGKIKGESGSFGKNMGGDALALYVCTIESCYFLYV